MTQQAAIGLLELASATPDAVIQAWTELEGNWQVGYWDRLDQCRRAQAGEQLFTLGPEFDLDGTTKIRLRIPQALTVPLKVIGVMSKRLPYLRREADSPSQGDESISTNTEGWVNTLIRKLVKWDRLIARLFLDGAIGVVAVPSPVHWETVPDFINTIDPSKYDRLSPEKRARYAPSEDGRYEQVDRDGNPVPKKKYRRDSRGRAADHPYYKNNPDQKFKLDDAKSRAAYEKSLQATLAMRPPFSVRIIQGSDVIPIYGSDDRLDGMLVRSSYTRQALIQRNYDWTPAQKTSDALIRVGDEEQTAGRANGDVTVYEYWGYDSDGSPYVSYAVEGATDTRFKDPETGEVRPATINLGTEFGLKTLPAGYFLGLNLETNDRPKAPIPFLWPVLSAMTMVEAFLSAKAAHTIQHGFTSWAFEANAEIVKLNPDILLEGNKPREYRIKPMTAVLAPGKPHPLVAPTTSSDVAEMIRLLLGMTAAMTPSEAAFGGDGATSGHDRSLTRDYLETAMSQVYRGALEAWEFIGERLLEAGCGLSEMFDIKVPINAKPAVPQTGLRSRTANRRPKLVELDPEWLDGIYDLEGTYPFDFVENIALINMASQLYKDGLITWEELRAFLGDEAPEYSRIALFVNQQLNTDDGKALIAAMANEIMGGDLQSQIDRLVEQGLMTPDGEPVESLVSPDEMDALKFLADKKAAQQLAAGAGPFGPPGPPLPPTSPAAIQGLVGPGGALPPLGAPGSVPTNSMTPPGIPQAPPPPGGPGQRQNIGTGVPFIPNSMLGGQIAGATEARAKMNDEIARQSNGQTPPRRN